MAKISRPKPVPKKAVVGRGSTRKSGGTIGKKCS